MTESVRAVSLRAPLARLFVDYNPFYLLSALSMLAGLFALNRSLDWSPFPEHHLLYLIVILNIYEAMLVGLGIFLASCGLMRDASTLFILEAVFLVDAGFLSAELFAMDFELAIGIHVALFFMAFLKLAGVFHGLRISLADGRYILMLSQMLVLFMMPAIFRREADWNDATLPPAVLFGYWWLIGVLPLLYLLLHNHEESPHGATVGVFLGLAFVSVLAHLCAANWVYQVRWYSGNLSPVLLGLAAAIGASDRHVRHVALRMRMHLLLPVLAVVLSLNNWGPLHFDIGGVRMSPLRTVLIGSAMVYFFGMLIHQHPYFAIAGIFCSGAAWLGPSPELMSQSSLNASLISTLSHAPFVPTTAGEWGIVSVVLSPFLVASGLPWSLHKPRPRLESDAEAVSVSHYDAGDT